MKKGKKNDQLDVRKIAEALMSGRKRIDLSKPAPKKCDECPYLPDVLSLKKREGKKCQCSN